MKEMGNTSYLIKKGDTFWFRRAVPVELIAIIGNKNFMANLKTSSRKAANRNKLFHYNESERKIECARAKLNIRPAKSITQTDIEYLANAWLTARDRIKSDEYEELMQTEQLRSHSRQEIVEQLEQDRDKLEQPDDLQVLSSLQDDAKNYVEDYGIAYDPKLPLFHSLVDLMRRAEVEVINRSIQRYSGTNTHLYFDPAFNHSHSSSRPNEAREASPSLAVVISEYDAEFTAGRATKNTKHTYQLSFQMLKDVWGEDTPISAVSRDMVRDLRGFIGQLPKNANKLFKGESFAQIKKALEGKKQYEPIGAKTANSYLTPVRRVLKYAYDEGYFDDPRIANLKDFSIPVTQEVKTDPFSSDELNLLFDEAHYPPRPNTIGSMTAKGEQSKSVKFWLPLIGLYSGMRLNEICQLMIADIKEKDGVPYFDVTKEGHESKTLKNAQSKRIVPIHPELLNLGFMEFVASLKRANSKWLFPSLSISKDGYKSPAASKWFARFRKERGIEGYRKSFHSFRHTFRTRLEICHVPIRRIRMLGGWKQDGGAEETYMGDFPIQDVAKELAKLKYDALDLSDL